MVVLVAVMDVPRRVAFSRAAQLMKGRLPLAYQILTLQVGIVLAAALIGTGVAVLQARQELDRQYEERSLAIAESVASTEDVQRALATGDSTGVQEHAEAVRASTGATYVVIADRRGIRYSHPNPTLIGKSVDENPAPVLAGHTWVGVQQGTLGVSARGKAPVYYQGQVVGMVSVGFLETRVWSELLAALPGYATTIVAMLALGIAGSVLLARRVKAQTFGLEPFEIAGLLEQREASLHGIGEGALATDGEGRVTLVNEQARRLLGLPENAAGQKLSSLLAAGRVLEFLLGRLNDEDEILVAGGGTLIASRRPVILRGRTVGHIITLRDSGELRRLSGGLPVESLTDALRAQAHEFSNRLHVIAGLLELGKVDEATKLIGDLTRVHQRLSESLLERIGDPVLGALLLAKAAAASERGIEFEVSEATALEDSPFDAADLIALVGNLIDNALDAAAAHKGGGSRRVEVSVDGGGPDILVRVKDSGPGVKPEDVERIFREGYTTKRRRAGQPRGVGLTLAREVARRYGGDIEVSSQDGAVFEARVPRRVRASA